MKRFPPSLDPKLYTISAFAIGLALIDNFTANEQNAIGNWFITIGQTLENSAAWQQVVEERIQGNTININSIEAKCGGSPYMNNPPLYSKQNSNSNFTNNSSNQSLNDYFVMIEKTLKVMSEEIEKLKKERH